MAAEREQCRIVSISGGPFQVRHSSACTADYCATDYQCDQMNRRLRRHGETTHG